MTAPAWVLRPYCEDDRSFILSSWLKSYRGSEFAQRLPADVYWSRYGHVGVVEDSFMRSRVWVATLHEERTWIYGWAAVEGDLLHYVFVRREDRKAGIGRALMEAACPGAACLRVSHVTSDFERLACGRSVEFVNPYQKEKANED